jgi:hypothetical protein
VEQFAVQRPAVCRPYAHAHRAAAAYCRRGRRPLGPPSHVGKRQARRAAPPPLTIICRCCCCRCMQVPAHMPGGQRRLRAARSARPHGDARPSCFLSTLLLTSNRLLSCWLADQVIGMAGYDLTHNLQKDPPSYVKVALDKDWYAAMLRPLASSLHFISCFFYFFFSFRGYTRFRVSLSVMTIEFVANSDGGIRDTVEIPVKRR